MKRVIQYTVRALTFSLIFLMFGLVFGLSAANAAAPTLKPAIATLGYFIGDWECSGKFDSSGKTIEAHQSFTPDLDGAWIAFRHDDKPPFSYHALAEWGWDDKQKKFVMTTQDSAGGVRLFYSNGWDADKIQWDGDTINSASTPTQRFTFEKVDDRHFRVSYFVFKNGAWARVDSSTCSQQ
jgi:hypothetical protein